MHNCSCPSLIISLGLIVRSGWLGQGHGLAALYTQCQSALQERGLSIPAATPRGGGGGHLKISAS